MVLNYAVKHTLTGHIGKVYAAKFTVDSNRVVSLGIYAGKVDH